MVGDRSEASERMEQVAGAKRTLSILHIAETYPPDYGGGAAIYIRDVCRLMADRGHSVRVVCTENTHSAPYSIRTEYDGAVQVDRVNLPYFKAVDPEGWQLGLIRWRRHQRRVAHLFDEVLTTCTPDLVHYHACRPLGEEPLAAVYRYGIPIVGMLHEGWLICARVVLLRSPTGEACEGPRALRCLECMYSHYDKTHVRAALKLPWRIVKLGVYPAYRLWRRRNARRYLVGAIAYSRFVVRMHERRIDGPVRYVSLGVDLQDVPEIVPARPRTPLRFGFVGGFHSHKGIAHVLDACAALKECGLVFELHVWGPDGGRGLEEVALRGLEDRVVLHGMFEREQRWTVYEEIDVALMATTVCEALGRVPMEAAAVGAPTIAPAVGGIPETIRDEEDGLLYRFLDPKDLERQMRRVLEEPGLMSRLLKNVRRPVETADRASAVEDFYFDVLSRRSDRKD